MQVFYFYRKKGESFHLIIEFNKFITYQNKNKKQLTTIIVIENLQTRIIYGFFGGKV